MPNQLSWLTRLLIWLLLSRRDIWAVKVTPWDAETLASLSYVEELNDEQFDIDAHREYLDHLYNIK